MKKLIICLLICMWFFLTNNCFAIESLKDFKYDFPGNDTFNHLAIGAGAAALATYYLPKDMNPLTKFFIGVAAGTIAGCISESLDEKWDNKDLAQWSMGGAMGVGNGGCFYPYEMAILKGMKHGR